MVALVENNLNPHLFPIEPLVVDNKYRPMPSAVNNNVINSTISNKEKEANQVSFCGRVKKTISLALEKVVEAIRNIVSFLAYAVNSLLSLQALCKFGTSTIKFFKNVGGVESEGTAKLGNVLGIVDNVLNFGDLVLDVKDWLVPKVDPHDGQKKMFWRHHDVSRIKIASRIFGTVQKALSTVTSILDLGLSKLGGIGAAIGQFSPLRIVKDVVGIISGSLSVVDDSIKSYTYNIEGKIESLKLQKWKLKGRLLAFTQMNEESKTAKLATAVII